MSAVMDLDTRAEQLSQLRKEALARRDDATVDGTSHAVVVPLASVAPRAIGWHWHGWLARGKLHLIGGHPGDGKSTIALDLAARLSRGGAAPDGTRLPALNTLIVAAEDDIADTIRPRLDLHGADVNRIFAIQHVVDEHGKDRSLSLAAHVEELRSVILQHRIGLVIIDPITSYLSKTDRNAEGDVRDALMPLMGLIEQTGIAVLGVMHVGKSTLPGRKPLQQLLGSTAFGAIARVVWMTADLPEDEQPAKGEDGTRETRKVLGVVKSNIGVRPPAIEWSRPMDAPIVWHGVSAHTVDSVMSGAPESKLDTAIENITHQLRHGPKAQKLVESEAADADISKSTLRRAYEHLRGQGKVRAYKASYQPYPWLWEWVGEDAHLRGEDAHPRGTRTAPFREDAQDVHELHVHLGDRLPRPDGPFEEVI